MAEKRFFVRVRGKTLGPFDLRQLKHQRDRGHLGRFHEVSEDRVSWCLASSIPELFPSEEDHAVAGEPPQTALTKVLQEPAALPHVVVVGATVKPPTPIAWHYLAADGTDTGPVTRERLLDLLDEGRICLDTLVWSPSVSDWTPLESVPGLLDRPTVKSTFSQTRTSGLALASVIAAVLWFGGLGSIAAVVLGWLALREIGRPKHLLRGRWLALSGVIGGSIGCLLTLVGGIGFLIFYIARGPDNHTPEKIASEYRDKVYFIRSKAGSGSGILIANNHTRGLIATNLHVIDPKLEEDKVLRKLLPDMIPKNTGVDVKSPSQLNSKQAMLAAFHRDFDLALLVIEMDNARVDAVPVARQGKLHEGESAVAMGYPLGLHLSTTNGVISNPRGESGQVWTTCPISSGNSGGPLFIQRRGLLAGLNTETYTGGDIQVGVDAKGKVVGRKPAEAQNFNGAVPAEQIVITLREGRTDNWIWEPELKDVVVDLAKTVPLKD